MATCNGERFLAEQIESLRYQTHENWRLLISDDCSTDGTLAIADGYAAFDSRIEVVSRGVRYGSAKANFMSLLERADADYIMFCDQDDVWFDDKIERSLIAMHELEAAVGQDVPLLVFGDMVVVDEDAKLRHHSFTRLTRLYPTRVSFPQVVAQALGAGCTMMLNRELACLVMRGRELVDSMVMHDWWTSMVASAYGSIRYIDEPLCMYRQHERNSIGAVQFRVLGKQRRAASMMRSMREMLQQADSFRIAYASDLTACNRDALDQLAAAERASGLPALVFLHKSGCWKGGIRKIGQIMTIIRK